MEKTTGTLDHIIIDRAIFNLLQLQSELLREPRSEHLLKNVVHRLKFTIESLQVLYDTLSRTNDSEGRTKAVLQDGPRI